VAANDAWDDSPTGSPLEFAAVAERAVEQFVNSPAATDAAVAEELAVEVARLAAGVTTALAALKRDEPERLAAAWADVQAAEAVLRGRA
jgi:sigma54-dependent transcription regulator